MKAFVITLALVAGNFVYQAFTAQDWAKAFERSFFQILAVGVVCLQCRNN